MKRVIGFALFCVALGMVLALILPNMFVAVLCIPETFGTLAFIIGCLVIGYNLFCC